MIGVRVTTSAYSHGGEGKRGKCAFVPADHGDSKIVVGVEATKLLQAGRMGSSLTLQLGYVNVPMLMCPLDRGTLDTDPGP